MRPGFAPFFWRTRRLDEGVTDRGELSQRVAGIREGAILAGKYRVERLLGVGGMGLVVAARHLQLDERVAVKLMLPETLGSVDAVTRFTREARAAAKIKGENVARVFDIGTLENGAPYIVMEFLEGRDLAVWVTQSGPLPVDLAVEFVLQTCVAVAEAHGLGIVHRDLKPANLFCVSRHDGRLTIKVLDFGISKLTDVAGSLSGATKTNTVMGSPHYMSPEQMLSAKDVDARTDIWALGVVLYELVTGAVPFGGDSYAEVAIKVATQAAPPLRRLRPEAPAGLEAAVLKCLQKDKGQRFRDVGELVDALADFAPNRSRRSVDRVAGVIGPSERSARPPPGDAFSLEPERTLLAPKASPETISPVGVTAFGRKRRGAALGITAAAAALVAVGFAAWRTPWMHADKVDTVSARPSSLAPPSSTALGGKLSAVGAGGSQESIAQGAIAPAVAEAPLTGPIPLGTTRSAGTPTSGATGGTPTSNATALLAARPSPPATSPPPTVPNRRHAPVRSAEPALARVPDEKVAPVAASAASAPVRAAVPLSAQSSAATPSNALDLPLMR